MAIPHSPATWGKQQAMCWYLLSTWFPNWCMDVHPKKSYHMGSDTFPIQTAWRCQTHTKQIVICQLGSSTLFFFTNNESSPTIIMTTMNNYIWLVVLTILKNISQWEGLSHILLKMKNVWNHQPDIICFDTIFWWLKIAIFGAEISGRSQACGSLTIFGVPFCLEFFRAVFAGDSTWILMN